MPMLRLSLELLGVEALFLLIPGLMALFDELNAAVFFIPALIAIASAVLTFLSQRGKRLSFSRSEGFAFVFLAWVLVCVFGSLPLYFSGYYRSFADALYESVSGFTTTGSTMLANVEDAPQSLHLWRALSHWIGGMGIVVLTVALLPLLGGNAADMVNAESPGPETDRISPRLTGTAKKLWLIYVALTVILLFLLRISGLPWFDALFNALSTMGTGGFSNRASSIASYGLPSVEWLICIFMLLAGSNFSLFHYALQAKWKLIYRNSEFRAYLLVVLVSALVSTLALTFAANSGGLRQALFHVASVISTTGYSVSNQDTWPALAQAPVFFLMFVGGCTGSTAGGIKVLRWLILCKQSKNEMRHLLHPQGVFSLQLDGGPGKREVVNGIAGFVFVYLFLLMAGFIIISLAGVGLADSLNASLMCLGNIGLAFSSSGQGLDLLIQGLPVWVKVFCSILMLIGRLELWAALVFFNPKFWRR